MRRQALLVLAVALLAAPIAHAKTRKVDWREQKTFPSGGALKFHVTKIVATTTSWSVTATITNASRAAVALEPKGDNLGFPSPNPVWHSGMALLELHRVRSASAGGVVIEWWQHVATSSRPAFPQTIAAGAAWTGTFGGTAKLQPGRSFSIGFGLFQSQAPAEGGRTTFWITDHSFTL